MTESTDSLRPDNHELGAAAAMHARWAGARRRLMHGPAPQGRPAAPRPVSPFVRAIREQRAAAERAARERIERERNGAPPENAPHWSQIVHEVAKKHGLTYRDLMSRSRFREIVTARYEAFYRIRNEVQIQGEPMSFPQIGRRFGGMDHTTVLHGYRKHKATLAK